MSESILQKYKEKPTRLVAHVWYAAMVRFNSGVSHEVGRNNLAFDPAKVWEACMASLYYWLRSERRLISPGVDRGYLGS